MQTTTDQTTTSQTWTAAEAVAEARKLLRHSAEAYRFTKGVHAELQGLRQHEYVAQDQLLLVQVSLQGLIRLDVTETEVRIWDIGGKGAWSPGQLIDDAVIESLPRTRGKEVKQSSSTGVPTWLGVTYYG